MRNMTTSFARSPVELSPAPKILKQTLLAAAVAAAGMAATCHGAAAASSTEAGTAGTVNAVSENEIARAKGAISHAGYQPVVLQMAQDHNVFFTGTKGAETYGITVTPGGKLYVSTGISSGRQS